MNNKKQSGFTLIEILVMLPVVSFIITVLVVLAQRSYYTILANNAETNLNLEAQTILFPLQDELLFATDYAETKSSDLNDSFAPSGGWRFDSNPQTLIVYETTLDKPRRDPNREFVYKRSYACGSYYSGYNPIATDNIIYFMQANSDNDYYTLRRRILTPQYSTCGTNYRPQTCPSSANFGTGGCQKVDTILSDHVVSFKIDYFDEDNFLIDTGNGGSPLEAEKLKIRLTLGNKILGKTVDATSTVTMRKIN